MPNNTTVPKKPHQKPYKWSDEDTRRFLEWWVDNWEYTRTHAMSEWRNRAKEELFNGPEHNDLTVSKITNKHDTLIKEYKAVKREYCETTGGGKNETDTTLDETLQKAFKWYHELEDIMGDKPNAGVPIASIDSLLPDQHQRRHTESASCSPAPTQRQRDKSKAWADRQVEPEYTPSLDMDWDELNEEERQELPLEMERRQSQDADGEEPAALQAAVSTREKRRKNLKKLAQTAKSCSSARKQNPAVTAANEHMDVLMESNERIQKEKIAMEERLENKRIETRAEMEERMESKRLEARAAQEKEQEERAHKHRVEMVGLVKDIIHDVASVLKPPGDGGSGA